MRCGLCVAIVFVLFTSVGSGAVIHVPGDSPTVQGGIDVEPGFITVSGTRFLDAQGRQLILNGVNVVDKNPGNNYLGNETQATFAEFRTWGFNCIRLGVIWDGLEPEPGLYDEEYLKGIDERIEWAEANGIYVLLDMHQDLFSVKFSDGAPEWATLDEGKEHLRGEVNTPR